MSHKNVTRMALALAVAIVVASAQDKGKQKVPKSDAEAKLLNAVVAETDAAKRLTELDQWVKEFPDSDWNDARPMLYLVTYQQLNKNREAFDKANEILATKPDDFMAISAVLRLGPALNNNSPSPADMDTVEKICEYVMGNPDKVFADGNRPDTISAADWAKVRPYWEPQSKVILLNVYNARKDQARTETKLKEKATQYPNDPVYPLALLNFYFQQIKEHPEKQPLVLFYYARAASIEGKLAPSAADKQKYMGSFTRNYKTYHGSEEGMNNVIAAAKANPVAPPDLNIKSTVDIAKENAEAEEKEAAANPAMATWKTVKTGLTGDNPDQFFEGSVKEAGLPGNNLRWKGKIVSMKPAIRPKTLVVAVEKPEGDVTLSLDMPLAGKMEPGEEIQFEGTVKAYQKEPYMLTLEVEKEKLVGWTGKNAPAGKKAAPAAKKVQ